LNEISGRSFSTLSQYPVFPWVLTDYSSEELRLENPTVYRDFSKSIGAGKKNPEDLISYYQETSGFDTQGYHFAIHYSSPANVLHYLIRLEPFTQCHWKLNRGFDNANRIFHNIGVSWNSSGLADMKELIPEFFYFPEFLKNGNCLDFGQRITGQAIDDVVLPQWCHENEREFVRIHRQALESSQVSAQISFWIDLIFGVSQRGQPAIDSLNLYKPKSYDTFLKDRKLNEIDMLEIREFGQTPKQLFSRKHPLRNQKDESKYLFFNSMDCFTSQQLISCDYAISCIFETDDKSARDGLVYVPMWNRRLLSSGYNIQWGLSDGSLKFTNTKNQDEFLFSDLHKGRITCLGASRDGRTLVLGGDDDVLSVWRIQHRSNQNAPVLSHYGLLVGHYGAIRNLALAEEFGVVVSYSDKNVVIVWDLNRLCASFFMSGFEDDVTAVDVDRDTGDIVVCCSSAIYVWDINGKFIAMSRVHNSKITCAKILSPLDVDNANMSNLIITGHEDGAIRLWSLALAPLISI
jgi:hypothetical protein